MDLSQIIKNHQLSYKAKKEITVKHPLLISSDLKTLKIAYDTVARDMCYSRSKTEYAYDDDNKEAITELLKYLICDSTCKHCLHKGIFLMGGVGTGKTLIMEVIKELVLVSRKIIEIRDAKEINMMYKDDEQILKLQNGILCIDDLGTEEDGVNNYGTKLSPMFDLITARYRKGRYTLITTNLDIDGLMEKYDARIIDRFNEMFNIIPLEGESRRK